MFAIILKLFFGTWLVEGSKVQVQWKVVGELTDLAKEHVTWQSRIHME